MIELKKVIKSEEYYDDFIKIYNKKFSGNKGLRFFESYLLYSFIRKYKPKTIYEMSPNQGWSTFLISNAIIDENFQEEIDFFHSYDLHNSFSIETKEIVNKIKNFNFYLGDCREKIKFDDDKQIDFWLIDSDHSLGFSKWYINFVKKAKYFFVHDINPSKIWHNKFRTNDENFYNGGEPKSIYEYIEKNGYKQSEKSVFLNSNFLSSNQQGEYNIFWERESSEQDDLLFGLIELYLYVNDENMNNKKFFEENCECFFYKN